MQLIADIVVVIAAAVVEIGVVDGAAFTPATRPQRLRRVLLPILGGRMPCRLHLMLSTVHG